MEMFDEIEWETLLNESDVNLYWSSLNFMQVMEVCILSAMVKTKKRPPMAKP